MTLTIRCAELQDVIRQQTPISANGYTAMGSNTLKSMLLAGTFQPSSYESSVFTTSGPWIVIAALALIIYLIFLTNAIWLRNCPQKATGLMACCRLPRNRAHTKLLLAIGLFLCTGALASSIAGAVLGGSNRDNGDKAACAMIDFADRVRNGSMTQTWGGTNKSLSSYYKVRDMYTSSINAVKSWTFSTDDTNMNAKVVLYEADLDLLYNAKGNYKVKSAKPDSTLTVEPDFITELGPSTTVGTHLATLKAESETLKTVVKAAADGLTTDVPNIGTTVTTDQSLIDSAATNYASFTAFLDYYSPLVKDYIIENYDKWVNMVNGINVSLYACIGFTALIVLSISYHHFFRSQLAIQIAYIAWNFLMLWTVVNAVFASQMQVYKKRALEHCDVFNVAVTDSSFVGNAQNFPKLALTSCFFSTGNTYDALSFGTPIAALGKIAYYVRSIEPYTINGPGSLEIATQKKIIDLYIQGLVPANLNSLNADGTTANLATFNSYSNSAATGNLQTQDAHCSISKDRWVLNLTNCTTLPFSPAYAPADYFGQDICLSILSLDSGTIKTRYTTTAFTGCDPISSTNIANILVSDYNALNEHFEDTRIKFGQLKRFYDNNLNFKYNETIRAATSLTYPIQDFNKSFAGFLDYIAGSQHGILNNSNCAFFKNDLLSANTFVCDTASGLEKTFITHVVAVVCSAVGCVFIYLYLRKLEGTFRLISNKEDSDLEAIVHSPIPQELQGLDASVRGDNERVLDDAEI